MQAPRINGHTSANFAAVADAFKDNFTTRGDTGAACSVIVGGETVVDLWGGSAGDAPWNRDTRSVVFSVSKGITTICLLMAAESGLIDVDETVSHYWPEFSASGKGAVTVRQLVAHQAGLIAPTARMSANDLRDWSPVVEALAHQAPLWSPGEAYAYHALTFGWLAGEVLRRATGRRPSEWLREHIAGPLGLASSFGTELPDQTLAYQAPTPEGDPPPMAPSSEEARLVNQVLGMNGAFDGVHLFESANSDDFLTCEMPAANLVSSAHDLARLYAATIGEVDGVRLLRSHTITDARRPQSFGKPFLGPDEGNRWATGFMIDSTRRHMAGPGSFGHDGAGGQLAFANPELGVAFAYTTIQPGGADDRRAEELCTALRSCL